MARFGDTGPYAVGNVKIILHTENTKEGTCFENARLPETRKKIGLWHKGKIVSDQTKKKQSDVHKGKTQSENTKKKRSVAMKKLWESGVYDFLRK